jgi:hypothetical protein
MVARIFLGEKFFGEGPEKFFCGRLCDVMSKGKDSGQDALDVAIKDGDILLKGDGSNGTGGVGADTGQCEEFGEGGGKFSRVLSHDGAGEGVEVASAAVVAESFPVFEDFIFGGGGEGGPIRERGEPAGEVGEDGGDLCLLAHEF